MDSVGCLQWSLKQHCMLAMATFIYNFVPCTQVCPSQAFVVGDSHQNIHMLEGIASARLVASGCGATKNGPEKLVSLWKLRKHICISGQMSYCECWDVPFFLDISSQNAALRILCKWFVVAGQLQHGVFKLGQVYTVFSNYFHDWKTASNWIFNLFPIKQHPTIGKKTTIFGYFVWEKVASDDSMTRHILLVHLRDFSCNVRRWSCVEKGNQMISNRHQSIQSIHINIPIHLRIHIYVRTYIYIYTVRISASW